MYHLFLPSKETPGIHYCSALTLGELETVEEIDIGLPLVYPSILQVGPLYNRRLYAEVRNAEGSEYATLLGGSVLNLDVRYRATLRRSGGALTLYLNGVLEAAGEVGAAIRGLSQWTIFNQYANGFDPQQCSGTAYSLRITAEALPLSRV